MWCKKPYLDVVEGIKSMPPNEARLAGEIWQKAVLTAIFGGLYFTDSP